MNEMKVARGLGWFSLGLGLAEVAAGRLLSRSLGMEDRTWLVQLYGLREITTGIGIFAMDNPRPMIVGSRGGRRSGHCHADLGLHRRQPEEAQRGPDDRLGSGRDAGGLLVREKARKRPSSRVNPHP